MSRRFRPGLVYFAIAHAPERSFVRIGFTWSCPWERLAQLAVASPLPLTIGGLVSGLIADEKEYHSIYKQYHVRGEWFLFKGPLIALVNGLPAPDEEAYHRVRTGNVSSSCSMCQVRGFAARASFAAQEATS